MQTMDLKELTLDFCLITEYSVIKNAGRGFLELCGYSEDEIINQELSTVFSLLRLPENTVEKLKELKRVDAFLFTKTLECREITIELSQSSLDKEVILLLTEKPGSKLSEKFPFLVQLISDNNIGTIIYDSTDFRVLQANEKYMKFFRGNKFNKHDIFGRCLQDFISDFKGSKAEKTLNDVIKSGKSVYFPGNYYESDMTIDRFWDKMIMPLYEDGKIKYLVSMRYETTENERNKKKILEQSKLLEEKNAELEQKNAELNAIIENVRCGIFVNHKGGESYHLNDATDKVRTLGDDRSIQHFTLDKQPVPYEKSPTFRALNGEKVKSERIINIKDDKELILEITSSPVYDKDGNVIMAISSAYDITELVDTQRELEKHKYLLESVIENLPDPFGIYNSDGVLIKMNAAGRKYYSKDDTQNNLKEPRNYLQYFDLEGNAIPLEDLPARHALRGEAVKNRVLAFRNNDEDHVVEISATPIFDKDQRLIAFTSLYRDITEMIKRSNTLKEAKLLAESETTLLNKILNNLNDAVAVIDPEGKMINMNLAWLRVNGVSTIEEYQNENRRNYIEVTDINDDPIPIYDYATTRAARGEVFSDYELKFRRSDKNITSIGSYSSAPIYDENGKLIMTIITLRDISEIKKNLEEINKQKTLLEAVIENMSDNVTLRDKEGHMILSNIDTQIRLEEFDTAYDLDKKGYEQITDLHYVPIPSENLPIYRALKGETVRNFKMISRRSNSERIFDVSAIPIYKNNELTMAVACSHDITDFLMAQKELEAQKNLLEAVIENIPDQIFIIDNEGKTVKINAAGRKLYPQNHIYQEVYEASKGLQHFDLGLHLIQKEDLAVTRVLRGEQIKHKKMVIKHHNVTQIVEVSAVPIFDENNHLTSAVISHHDITENVHNQQLIEKQQVLMLQKEKEKIEALNREIEMKDEFLSLISHEFKTPIMVINAAAQAMERICDHELSDKAKDFIFKIRRNADRQLKLVNNLLDVTRINAGRIQIRKKNIDIILLTRSITESISTYAEQKEVGLSFQSELHQWEVGIDDEQYEKILLNLLSNAVKFTPSNKSIFVNITHKIIKDQSSICVEVKDEGIGIPYDKKKVIFDRFGQVDEVMSRNAEGTGIGLHIVKKLVGLLNGEISVQSEVGVGSTFTLTLPAEKVIEAAQEQKIMDLSDDRIIRAVSLEFSDVNLTKAE